MIPLMSQAGTPLMSKTTHRREEAEAHPTTAKGGQFDSTLTILSIHNNDKTDQIIILDILRANKKAMVLSIIDNNRSSKMSWIG